MTVWDIAGGPSYDIVELWIAANNLDGTFGTPFMLPSCDLFSVKINVKSAQARGNGRITAIASQIESAGGTLRNASITQAIYATMWGKASLQSGTTPNRQKRLALGSERAKWFGILGKSLAGDDGDTHIFLPYVRCVEAFDFRFEYNAFTVPEITVMALVDPVLLDTGADGNSELPLVLDIVEHETEATVVFPPANINYGV